MLMKRIIPLLSLFCCLSIASASYDRLIGPGEYEYFLEWISGELVVDGGGAEWIELRNSARLEIWSTSPLGYNSGIWDIVLTNTSRLDYYGGETEELTLYKDAVAHLYGGRIDYITSFQNVFWYYGQPTEQHVTIYCQAGWSWIEDSQLRKVGIQGVWADDTPFTIQFLDRTSFGADPTWANINVIEVIPEPTTMLLLGLGGVLLWQRRV